MSKKLCQGQRSSFEQYQKTLARYKSMDYLPQVAQIKGRSEISANENDQCAKLNREKQSLERTLSLIKTGAMNAIAEKQEQIQILRLQFDLTEQQKMIQIREEVNICSEKIAELQRINSQLAQEKQAERNIYLRQMEANQIVIQKMRNQFEQLEQEYLSLENYYRNCVFQIQSLEEQNLNISMQLELSQSKSDKQLQNFESKVFHHQKSKSAPNDKNPQQIQKIKQYYQDKLSELKEKFDKVLNKNKSYSALQIEIKDNNQIYQNKQKQFSTSQKLPTDEENGNQLKKTLLKCQSLRNNLQPLNEQKIFLRPSKSHLYFKKIEKKSFKKQNSVYCNRIEGIPLYQRYNQFQMNLNSQLSICPQQLTPRDEVSIQNCPSYLNFGRHKMIDQLSRFKEELMNHNYTRQEDILEKDSSMNNEHDDSKSTIKYIEVPRINKHKSTTQLSQFQQSKKYVKKIDKGCLTEKPSLYTGNAFAFISGLIVGSSLALILPSWFKK